MAARIPQKAQATEEPAAEQGTDTPEPSRSHTGPSATEANQPEADAKSRRRLPRKRVRIPIIAAVTAIVLGVGGWLIYTNVQLAQAKDAYETSLSELSATQEAADTANAELAAALATLSAHVDIAEQLVSLLGDDGDILQAAGATTVDARAVLEATSPTAPSRTAGELSESPTVEEYDVLRAKVDELVATVVAYTTMLNERITALTTSNTELTVAWQAQTATVPDVVEAALAANANGSQGTKDAVTAAGEALTALEDPLDSEAVELWQALQSTASTLASEEKAYQDQKAAEEEAARQRARNNSGGGNPGSGGGNQGGGNPGGGGSSAPSMQELEASLAAYLGISASQVNCYPIPRGSRCDYPGGYSIVTI